MNRRIPYALALLASALGPASAPQATIKIDEAGAATKEDSRAPESFAVNGGTRDAYALNVSAARRRRAQQGKRGKRWRGGRA